MNVSLTPAGSNKEFVELCRYLEEHSDQLDSPCDMFDDPCDLFLYDLYFKTRGTESAAQRLRLARHARSCSLCRDTLRKAALRYDRVPPLERDVDFQRSSKNSSCTLRNSESRKENPPQGGSSDRMSEASKTSLQSDPVPKLILVDRCSRSAAAYPPLMKRGKS